jgi:hypothetical protein
MTWCAAKGARRSASVRGGLTSELRFVREIEAFVDLRKVARTRLDVGRHELEPGVLVCVLLPVAARSFAEPPREQRGTDLSLKPLDDAAQEPGRAFKVDKVDEYLLAPEVRAPEAPRVGLGYKDASMLSRAFL